MRVFLFPQNQVRTGPSIRNLNKIRPVLKRRQLQDDTRALGVWKLFTRRVGFDPQTGQWWLSFQGNRTGPTVIAWPQTTCHIRVCNMWPESQGTDSLKRPCSEPLLQLIIGWFDVVVSTADVILFSLFICRRNNTAKISIWLHESTIFIFVSCLLNFN